MATAPTLTPVKRTGDPAPDTPLPPMPSSWRSLPRAFLHAARANAKRPAIADSTGQSLTYEEALMRAVALGRALGRELGDSPHVGVLLPPTVPAIVANLALALWGKVAVNLNYTAGAEIVNSCIDQAGITHVITARAAIKKTGIEPKGNLVYLEDVAKKVSKADKAVAFLVARALPIATLGAFLPGLRRESLANTATIIFTSGSTGEPKGVILTHGNVLGNVHQVHEHLYIGPEDTALGVLPLFHSFGYTVTFWLVLALGLRVVYHFNPLDARIVGNLCEEYKVTFLACSPTFMRNYAKKCDRDQFATVRLLLLGAEKLQPEVAQSIRERLGIEPMEGYGCTETGPVVAVNVSDQKRTPDGRTVCGNHPGTVGMLIPGTLAKTIDPDSGADLPRGAEGLVCIKGPQVMRGYLGRPDLTSKVLVNGWYNTGDLGKLDDDGFLTITGRLSRFSKIGGEMVPHERVEAAILEAAEGEHPQVAVTALPDPKRGERLIVLFTDLGLGPEEMYRKLMSGPMPKLWLPAIEDFHAVESVPRLASGKLDLRRVKDLAMERCRTV